MSGKAVIKLNCVVTSSGLEGLHGSRRLNKPNWPPKRVKIRSSQTPD